MYYLVDAQGSVIAKNVSFDRLQDRIDKDMLDAWVLTKSEYEMVYKTDDVKWNGYATVA